MYWHESRGRGYLKSPCMSVNAAQAYEDGMRPLSKLRAKDLKEAGADVTLGFAKWLAEHGYWEPDSWHHCGPNFKEVHFYDPEGLEFLLKNELSAEQLTTFKKEYHESKKNVKNVGQPVLVRRPGKTWSEKNVVGWVYGRWIYLNSGEKLLLAKARVLRFFRREPY